MVEVGAQVAGKIVEFGPDPKTKKTVDYGSQVEAGAILAKIDDTLLQTGVERAKAQLRTAQASVKIREAELTVAEREQEKARKLLTNKGISTEEFDEIVARRDLRKAHVEAAKAALAECEVTLKEAEINLGYAVIRSPIAGVVIDRRVTLGQMVGSSLTASSLFLMARDLKRMQVWASVPETDVVHVHLGDTATFTVDAYPGKQFRGKVVQRRLNAEMTKRTVTYTVVLDVDNSDGQLLPYLTADVRLVLAEKKAVLLVPNAALRWRPRREQVAPDFRADYAKFVLPEKAADAKESRPSGVVWVEDKGFVRPVRVRPGLSDGSVTEVVEGDLKEGAPVVVGDRGKEETRLRDPQKLQPDLPLDVLQVPHPRQFHDLPRRSNSAGRSPARLVFRTVHETFALIRLLTEAILVMDTSPRFVSARSMHRIMAVAMEGVQSPRSIVAVIPIGMMHFD